MRVDDLDVALAGLADAQAGAKKALRELHRVIFERMAEGGRGTQAELVRRTGYTRERIRQIVRDQAPLPDISEADNGPGQDA